MLVFVTAITTKVIHRQFKGAYIDTTIRGLSYFCKGDSKIGPMNEFIHEDNRYKHEVEYEFGMAFYWNIAISGLILFQVSVFFYY